MDRVSKEPVSYSSSEIGILLGILDPMLERESVDQVAIDRIRNSLVGTRITEVRGRIYAAARADDPSAELIPFNSPAPILNDSRVYNIEDFSILDSDGKHVPGVVIRDVDMDHCVYGAVIGRDAMSCVYSFRIA